jgi:hypothetical protein
MPAPFESKRISHAETVSFFRTLRPRNAGKTVSDYTVSQYISQSSLSEPPLWYVFQSVTSGIYRRVVHWNVDLQRTTRRYIPEDRTDLVSTSINVKAMNNTTNCLKVSDANCSDDQKQRQNYILPRKVPCLMEGTKRVCCYDKDRQHVGHLPKTACSLTHSNLCTALVSPHPA